MKQNNFIIRFKQVIKGKNIVRIIYDEFKLIFGYYYYKIFKSGTFTFQGAKLNYFYYLYNATWRNERAIEIPIIWAIVKKYSNGRILEVGNVLSHYFYVNHDILDKYEKARGVTNKDIVNFHSRKKYDLIVSISTLEHIGLDETPKEQKKILKSITNLKKSLSENGKIIFTVPIGYNLELDRMLKKGKIKLSKRYYLKRISPDNKWVEIDKKEADKIKFGEPFPRANGIVVGFIDKK